MDTLKTSLAEITEIFHARMSEFESELQKAPTASSTTSSLTTEFSVFRSFITQALCSLQQQVEILAHSVDSLEMRSRRKILLIHGVAEETKENTAEVLTEVVQNRLNLTEFTASDISRCHRMGRAVSNKTRPILFKLGSLQVRDKIWFSKAKLKGTGITVSEFLTKGRHDVLLAAREKFGVAKSWTKAGFVFVIGSDGKRQRIETLAELGKIGPTPIESTRVQTAAAAVKTTTTSKSKRAVTLKK